MKLQFLLLAMLLPALGYAQTEAACPYQKLETLSQKQSMLRAFVEHPFYAKFIQETRDKHRSMIVEHYKTESDFPEVIALDMRHHEFCLVSLQQMVIQLYEQHFIENDITHLQDLYGHHIHASDAAHRDEPLLKAKDMGDVILRDKYRGFAAEHAELLRNFRENLYRQYRADACATLRAAQSTPTECKLL